MIADTLFKITLGVCLVFGVGGLLAFHFLTRPRSLYQHEAFLMREVLAGYLKIPMQWRTAFQEDGSAIFLWPDEKATFDLEAIQLALNHKVELSTDPRGKRVLMVLRERYLESEFIQ